VGGPFVSKEAPLAHKRKRVVLVSTPGLVQQATRSTLALCPDVDLVAIASGALSATRVMSQMQPDVLLIDANLPEEEMEALLRWAKEHCPGTRCVVSTSTSQHSDRALVSGAHAAIHRAGLADQLHATLSHLPTFES